MQAATTRGNISLSALLAGKAEASYRRVVVDTLGDLSPPEGLRQVGLLAAFSAPGIIDPDFLDLVIAYDLAGVRVVMEVEQGRPVPDPAALLTVAANVGCALSLLPPDTGEVRLFQAYLDTVEAFAGAFASNAAIDKPVFPITDAFEDLVLDVLSPGRTEAMPTTSGYFEEAFAWLPTDRLAAVKARVEKAFVALHGEEGFLEFRKALLHGALDGAPSV